MTELEHQLGELLHLLDAALHAAECPREDTAARAVDAASKSEYVSIRELARRIPYAEQTIRNLMTRGVFRLGEHYIKPRSRIMFRWSRVREWLEREESGPG